MRKQTGFGRNQKIKEFQAVVESEFTKLELANTTPVNCRTDYI